MKTHWKCSCGARWPQWCFDIASHIKAGRAKGEEHRLVGLVDDATGKVLAPTMRQAVDKGLLPRSRGKGEGGSPGSEGGGAPAEGGGAGPEGGAAGGGDGVAGATEVRTSVRGRFVTEEVLLDGRLVPLYELARARFPQYDATIGEWIWDCIVQFYAEHADALRLGVLFADTFEPQPAKTEVGDG